MVLLADMLLHCNIAKSCYRLSKTKIVMVLSLYIDHWFFTFKTIFIIIIIIIIIIILFYLIFYGTHTLDTNKTIQRIYMAQNPNS